MKKFIVGCLSLAVAMSLNAKVLATVNNDINITSEDVAPLLNGLGAQNLDQFPTVMQKKILDKAIEYKLLTQQAIKSGIEKTAEFKDLIGKAEASIAVKLYQEQKMKNAKITDAEVTKFYNDNKNDFVVPATVHAYHILLKTKKEAEDLIKKLDATKSSARFEEFKKLAKKYSTDKMTKASGGDLGKSPRGTYVKPFEEALDALKVGTFTQKPVKTQYGYHIIYDYSQTPSSFLPLDKVKGYITELLQRQKMQQEIINEADALIKSAKVDYKINLTAPKNSNK